MYSKNHDKVDNLSKKNLRISELIAKNYNKRSKSKSAKKDYSNSIEYGTDSKKPSSSQNYHL